jgi:hypothetical protein
VGATSPDAHSTVLGKGRNCSGQVYAALQFSLALPYFTGEDLIDLTRFEVFGYSSEDLRSNLALSVFLKRTRFKPRVTFSNQIGITSQLMEISETVPRNP